MGKLAIRGDGSLPQLLAFVDEAKKFLAKAQNPGEVKDLRDQAAMARVYYRQRSDGLEAQKAAAEIKIRAERRIGELIRDNVRHEGGRPQKKPLHDVRDFSESLVDLGITYRDSSRWQKIASVPEKRFDRFIEAAKGEDEELTTAFVLREVNRYLDEKAAKTPQGLPPSNETNGHKPLPGQTSFLDEEDEEPSTAKAKRFVRSFDKAIQDLVEIVGAIDAHGMPSYVEGWSKKDRRRNAIAVSDLIMQLTEWLNVLENGGAG